MKAKVLPLKGKYYGTLIEVVPKMGEPFEINIWWMDDYTPSKRELDLSGMTLAQWEENDMGCDSHFETVGGLKVAEAIAKALESEA